MEDNSQAGGNSSGTTDGLLGSLASTLSRSDTLALQLHCAAAQNCCNSTAPTIKMRRVNRCLACPLSTLLGNIMSGTML